MLVQSQWLRLICRCVHLLVDVDVNVDVNVDIDVDDVLVETNLWVC